MKEDSSKYFDLIWILLILLVLVTFIDLNIILEDILAILTG